MEDGKGKVDLGDGLWILWSRVGVGLRRKEFICDWEGWEKGHHGRSVWECTYIVCLEEKLSEASWSFYLALSASDAYPASMYIISANRIAWECILPAAIWVNNPKWVISLIPTSKWNMEYANLQAFFKFFFFTQFEVHSFLLCLIPKFRG